MKIDISGTTLEQGDPCHISFSNRFCPLCNKSFGKSDWQKCGHLHTNLGIGTVLFQACLDHFAEAKANVTQHIWNNKKGYVGEWEPRFGLKAEISFSTERGTRSEEVVLI